MNNVFLEIELRLLIAHYGRHQVLQGLAKLVDSTVEKIESQLKEIEESKRKKKKARTKSHEQIIAEITKNGTPSRDSLEKLLSLYESRTFLPELRSANVFLERRGLSNNYKSRKEALPQVMRHPGFP